ncbi:MAG: hypothetical protein KH452_04385 [Clostridiales bacterium]|nr:hypothetical protein [Clostridiales bacterium]
MRYLIMECHPSYVVALDQQGRFLKAANLGYTEGQYVDEIILLQEPDKVTRFHPGQLTRIMTIAACFCLVFLGSWHYILSPVGTVRMQINPDILISVNRLNYVTKMKGLNEDGQALADGVRILGKKVDALSDELADRAVEMGYLKEEGEITLTIDSANAKWKTATEELLVLELEVHLPQDIRIISITPQEEDSEPKTDPPENQPVIIPVTPEPEPAPTPSNEDSSDDTSDD